MCKQHDQVFQVCCMQAQAALVATETRHARQMHQMRALLENLQQQLRAQTGRNTVLGTHADSSLQGFDKLQCTPTAEVCSRSHDLTELEQQFALGMSGGQHSAQPLHDGTACSQPIEAVLRHKRQKRGSSGPIAEQEAQPLSTPVLAMQAVAQAEAILAAKENSPVAANTRTGDQGTDRSTALDTVLHNSKLAASCAHVISSPRMVRSAAHACCTVLHACWCTAHPTHAVPS